MVGTLLDNLPVRRVTRRVLRASGFETRKASESHGEELSKYRIVMNWGNKRGLHHLARAMARLGCPGNGAA